MPRITIKDLEARIDMQLKTIDKFKTLTDTLKNEIDSKDSGYNYVIKEKNEEILQLQKHIGFVHAQRDRLIGFLEGRQSLTEPKVDVVDNSYHQPSNQTIDRFERFIRECSDSFIRSTDNGDEIRTTLYR